MTISAARTITLALPASSGFGTFAAPPQQAWPPKRVGELLDYSLDLAKWMADAADSIVSVTASASPAASGDLVLTEIDVAGSLVTLWASGGRPGVLYSVELDVTTASRRVDPVILLMVNPGGPQSTATPAPIAWTVALPMGLNFARPLTVSTVAAS